MPGTHIEFDGALELDDGFGMVAVFEQRIADGLRAVDEKAAKEAVLFLDDPVAPAIATDKDDGGCRAARWRFDELHVRCPSMGEQRVLPKPRTFRRCVLRVRMFRGLWSAGRRLDSCSQYLLGRI